MTTKLYQYVSSGGNQVRMGCSTAESKEYMIGWVYSEFEKAEGFKPSNVEVVEVVGNEIRRTMPGILSEKIEIGQRSAGATLVDDTIVFHVAIKSSDPAAIARQMGEIERDCTEEEFTAALKIVMSGCAFLKDMKSA